MFQAQVKRIHEYKRQLLLCLYIITLYNRLKANPAPDVVPQTFIFGGKAAPGYHMAKLIIKLIHQVGSVINYDPEMHDRMKVVFLPDYRVSLAEKIIPAADLSVQISTAGMEASGTGNMKFAMNGALTIGTLDGANIEIKEEVGDENIFIFGLTAEQVEAVAAHYDPRIYYESDEEIRRAVDLISNDFFSLTEPGIFRPIVAGLLEHGDYYMHLADLRSFIDAQQPGGGALPQPRRSGRRRRSSTSPAPASSRPTAPSPNTTGRSGTCKPVEVVPSRQQAGPS